MDETRIRELINECMENAQIELKKQGILLSREINTILNSIKNEMFQKYPQLGEYYDRKFEIPNMDSEISALDNDIIDSIYGLIKDVAIKAQNNQNLQEETIDVKVDEKTNDVNVDEKDKSKLERTEDINMLNTIYSKIADALLQRGDKMRVAEARNVYVDWEQEYIDCKQTAEKYAIQINTSLSNHRKLAIASIVNGFIRRLEDEVVITENKSKQDEIEFEEGAICQVVKDKDKFAKLTEKIAEDSKKEEGIMELDPNIIE